MKLTIGHLYPDLFNLYGDSGNVQCMKKRLEWRGIEAQVLPLCAGEDIDFGELDIVVWGGGADRGQALAREYLEQIGPDFKSYVEDGGVVLSVCGAFQLLGKYYKTGEGAEDIIKGLGILDIYTERCDERLVGNVVLESALVETPVVGFENHAGRTIIGDVTPFGKVLYGRGNTGDGGYEGVVYKNVIGTYLHGPLLPKNPQVCDWFLERALKNRYGEDAVLTELSDEAELLANRNMVERLGSEKRFQDSDCADGMSGRKKLSEVCR